MYWHQAGKTLRHAFAHPSARSSTLNRPHLCLVNEPLLSMRIRALSPNTLDFTEWVSQRVGVFVRGGGLLDGGNRDGCGGGGTRTMTREGRQTLPPRAGRLRTQKWGASPEAGEAPGLSTPPHERVWACATGTGSGRGVQRKGVAPLCDNTVAYHKHQYCTCIDRCALHPTAPPPLPRLDFSVLARGGARKARDPPRFAGAALSGSRALRGAAGAGRAARRPSYCPQHEALLVFNNILKMTF